MSSPQPQPVDPNDIGDLASEIDDLLREADRDAAPATEAAPAADPDHDDMLAQIDALTGQIDSLLTEAADEDDKAAAEAPATQQIDLTAQSSSEMAQADQAEIDRMLAEAGMLDTPAKKPEAKAAPAAAQPAPAAAAPPPEVEAAAGSSDPTADAIASLDRQLAQLTEELTEMDESRIAEAPPPAAVAPAPAPAPVPTSAPAATQAASSAVPATTAPTASSTTSAAAPAAPAAKAAATEPAPVAPAAAAVAVHAAAPKRRLGAMVLPVARVMAAPLASKPKVVRDTLGWIAASTCFWAAIIWGYLLFLHDPNPAKHEPPPFDFAESKLPQPPAPKTEADAAADGHGEAAGGHGKADAHGTKKAEPKKADAKKDSHGGH